MKDVYLENLKLVAKELGTTDSDLTESMNKASFNQFYNFYEAALAGNIVKAAIIAETVNPFSKSAATSAAPNPFSTKAPSKQPSGSSSNPKAAPKPEDKTEQPLAPPKPNDTNADTSDEDAEKTNEALGATVSANIAGITNSTGLRHEKPKQKPGPKTNKTGNRKTP